MVVFTYICTFDDLQTLYPISFPPIDSSAGGFQLATAELDSTSFNSSLDGGRTGTKH